MTTAIAAVLAWIACILALWQAFKTETTIHSTRNRLQAVEERLESHSGKLARAGRADRDAIREEVDAILQERDTGGSSGLDGSLLQQLMMSQMMGSMGQGNPEAPEPVQEPQKPQHFFGSGGKINAESQTGDAGQDNGRG